jgi:hypothetical protein
MVDAVQDDLRLRLDRSTNSLVLLVHSKVSPNV